MIRLHLVLALLALSTLACSRSPVEFTSAGAADAGTDDIASSDAAAADAATGDAADDAGTPLDAGTDVDALLPAPVIPGPERSAELDRLYCELSSGHIVQGALRAAACLDASVAGILDEASRGFIYGEILEGSYAPFTLGYCEVLRCLSNAADCDEAQACADSRVREPCPAYGRRCDGSVLEVCVWNGEGYDWVATQDCARMGTTCAESTCDSDDCVAYATCEGQVEQQDCSYYGVCDGDVMRRCAPADTVDGRSAAFDIDCGELVEGGTCIETPVGGEAPGPACSAPAPACSTAFSEGFACVSRTQAQLCLFGELVVIDCADYGYQYCADEGFFGVRCGG